MGGEVWRDSERAFVAMRTDWDKRWPNQKQTLNCDSDGKCHYPGWDVDTLKFLYETREIASNGHKTFGTGATVRQTVDGFVGEDYVLHTDHYQLEVMANLDKVSAVGPLIFAVVPKAEKAPGFPVRAFAILPE